MADRSEGRDANNTETYDCPEPQLEATQDLELLAQEIAEAAVEEERKLSRTPSPSPPASPPHSFEEAEAATDDESDEDESEEDESEEDELEEEESEEETDDDDLECDDDLTHLEEESSENLRSSSPVDEASWVLVDAADGEESKTEFPEQKFSVYRKFLARGDLRQKLADLGFTCDVAQQASAPAANSQQEPDLQNLVVSCSESIVICHLPQEGDGKEESASQVLIKNSPDAPRIPSWRGTVSEGTVSVEVERQGGLVVAAVTVRHRDLLSALTSLRSLVASTGLVSYADVDVPSLLARAA